jgi:hypothetical protein
MTPPKRRLATVPIYNDSSGREVIPGDAVSTGDFDLIAECEDRKRRLDERERKLTIKECDLNIRERRLDARIDDIAARENTFSRNRLVADATRRMKALKRRMDALEEEELAKYAEPISLPPGTDPDDPPTDDQGELDPPEEPMLILDEGELQAIKEPKPLEDNDGDDDDELSVLPRAPLGPTTKRDPDMPHPSQVEDD